MKSLGERLIYLDAPERRPRRAAYALPSMFTAGNVYLGFYALLEIYQASMQLVQGIAVGRTISVPLRSPSALLYFSTAWMAASRA